MASRRGSLRLPLGNNHHKNSGGRGRAVPPESRGAGSRRAGRDPQSGLGGSRAAPQVGGLKGPAPSVPGPQLRTGPRRPHAPSPRSPRGADAARTTSPRKPRERRGAGPGAIPRDPARWEAPLEDAVDAAAAAAAGGRRARRRAGRRRGRRGLERCVPGRGLAGPAAGGTGSWLRGWYGAGGSVPTRRAAHRGLGAGARARPGAQHTAR